MDSITNKTVCNHKGNIFQFLTAEYDYIEIVVTDIVVTEHTNTHKFLQQLFLRNEVPGGIDLDSMVL